MPVPLRANNLKVEAKFNVVTEFPNFDLHSAAAAGNIGLVEYALSRGQPVNSVLDGVLPLHAACAGGDEQVVKLLIDHGADVNAPRLPRKYSTGGARDGSAPIVGTSGSTPLHFAAANGNKSIILTLLLRGAHPDRADKYGVTPEMLARRNGWIECAELLQTWLEKRDRDLRERHNPVDDSSANAAAESRRVQVKRSIDTALNMLKASSPSLSDAYLKPPPSSTSANFASQTPPASPHRSEFSPIPSSSDDGRFTPSPSPIDLSTRRPSLPHLFYPSPPAPANTSSRTQKPVATTKNPSSPRRPRSAGNGADREDPVYASYGRGGAGRLGNKYSLMNIFKKAGETDGSTSHQSSSSLSIPTLPSQASSDSSTPPTSRTSVRPRTDSSNRSATPSSSQSQVKGFTPQEYSPSPHPPIPLAVDLHNALAQHHTTRDRSGSSGSRMELANNLGINMDDIPMYGSPGSSPLTRFGLVRNKAQPRHSRDRSGSGASLAGTLSANRSGSFFEEEVADHSGKTKPSRPGILRGHHRSTSFGQNHTNPRALRFDATNSTQSRTKDVPDRPPDSAPAAVADFEIMEEDEEYGHPLSPEDSAVRPSIKTESPTISSGFPFSINKPPIIVDETDSPVTVKLQVPSPIDSRNRGDSVSSNSTGDSLFNPPRLSRSDSTSAGTGTVSTPVLSGGEFSSHSSPKDTSKPLQDDDPVLEEDVDCMKEAGLPRRGNTILDIDMNLIESHEEAEALVQRAQQDILDLAHCDSLSPSQSSDGWTPLSARLAAYGESLALEKKLREQKEERVKSAGELDSRPLRSKLPTGVSRQSSLDHRTQNSHVRTKAPRRPHTSGGTGAANEGSVNAVSSLTESTSYPRQTSLSAPVKKQSVESSSEVRSRAFAQTPERGDRLSRASSLDGHDTDSEFGGPLTRVSTAPSPPHLKSRRDQSRSATKLTRMGFPNDLTTRTPTPVAPPSGKRFGLKSLMQSFKGKS